jgi:hypothetical protein
MLFTIFWANALKPTQNRGKTEKTESGIEIKFWNRTAPYYFLLYASSFYKFYIYDHCFILEILLNE